MKTKFQKDLDTLLTELAYDMNLKVLPQKGYRIVGLYGLPGDAVKRTSDGGLELTVETIFLSRERGGIYFAFDCAFGGGNRRNADDILAITGLVDTLSWVRRQSP